MEKTQNKLPYTKEKWRITEWLEITTSRKGIVEGSKRICQVSDFSKSKEEAKANAQLISASPEMYEALNVISSSKLRMLSDFLDKIDEEKGYRGKGVQNDLRRLAELQEQALIKAAGK